ncbi:MAG: hypothetical protein Q8L24_00900 [bacterium]|nr:hypothetical protein [bacterium]
MQKQPKEKELNKRATHKDFQDYIDMASEVFATKTDFKEFATKTDLKKFATKAEMLKTFATKDDLKELATKSELLEFKDEILTSNDKLSNKMDKILTEQTMQTNSYSRYDKEIEKLKGRVGVVERKVGLNPVS